MYVMCSLFVIEYIVCVMLLCLVFFFKQKTAYEMRISDWSSDVCSSDLQAGPIGFCSRCIIVEYPIATGSAQRVELERQLLVCGRDARIADQRHMLPDRVRFPIIMRSCPNRNPRSSVDGHIHSSRQRTV